MKKLLNGDQLMAWARWLVQTEQVQELVDADLRRRYEERKGWLNRQKLELPALEKELSDSSLALAAKVKAQQEAQEHLHAAQRDYYAAWQRNTGADNTLMQAEGRIKRRLAELADPRILVMQSWVWGLSQKVRAADRGWSLTVRTVDGGRKSLEQSNVAEIAEAMRLLDELRAELSNLLTADYDLGRLGVLLVDIRQQALKAAASVLTATDMQTIEEQSAELPEIQPTALAHSPA